MALAGQLLNVEQGSPEWHAERAKRIGASEIAATLGKSPYYTERELWLFKKGMVPEWFVQDEYIFDKGHRFEEKMRAEWFALTGQDFKPTVRVNKKYPHLIASLDGEFEDSIFEAKLLGKAVLQEIKETNKPPYHHWIQVQDQLMITKAEKCIYFAHVLDDEDGVVIEVFPDKKFQRDLLKTSIQFAKKLKNNEEPAMTKEDFFFAPDDPAFDELRALNEKKSQAKKAFEAIEKEYKEKLTALHSSFEHDNVANLTAKVKIKKMSRGTIAWRSIPEVIALAEDYIEKFRVAGSEYVQAWFAKK